MNWILTSVVKAVLEWLTSLLVQWREKLEHIEQGRQEVRDAVKKREEEIDRAIEEINKTRTNTSFDTALDELRNSASDNSGGNAVRSIAKPDVGNSK